MADTFENWAGFVNQVVLDNSANTQENRQHWLKAEGERTKRVFDALADELSEAVTSWNSIVVDPSLPHLNEPTLGPKAITISCVGPSHETLHVKLHSKDNFHRTDGIVAVVQRTGHFESEVLSEIQFRVLGGSGQSVITKSGSLKQQIPTVRALAQEILRPYLTRL